MDLHESLKNLRPEHDFFIGIDSDGCVFDSMEVKQKEFFIPLALKYFGLWPVSGILRKTWEYVNLYSVHRGGNRFISLLKVFDLLNRNSNVRDAGVDLPDMESLRKWIEKDNRLGNENLRKYFESYPDAGLEKILLWSEAVNDEISRWLRNIAPFPYARRAIEKISSVADIVVVSQTPLGAIEREWKENRLEQYVKAIAGQEHGTKTEHIALAAKDKYADARILMIGDAIGDYDAARNNEVLFYPVIPGKEDASWEKFYYEGFEKFIKGTFAGDYENSLLGEFSISLPENPPD